MLAKVFVCEFACNSSGAVREVGGLVVRKKGALPELSDFFVSLPAWLRCPVRCEPEPGEPMIVTCTKTVTVCTEPGPKVPRTVNWVGPSGTVVATCTGKEPGSPTVTLSGFHTTPGSVTVGEPGSFPVQAATTVPVRPTQFTVRGTFGLGSVQTVTVFVLVTSTFTLDVSPHSTSSGPIGVTPGGTLALSVQVVAGPGFAGTVFIDFPNLPAGFQATPGNVAAGATGSFPVQVAATALGGLHQFTVRGTSR